MNRTALHPLPSLVVGRRAPAPRPENARSLTTLLLATMVAALVVVADHFISIWANGHLFLTWVAMWAVVFAATALLATPARRLAQRTLQGLDAWARERAQAHADARLWKLAKSDHRIMAELVQARATKAQAPAEAVLTPLGLDNGVVQPLHHQSYL